VSMKPYDKIEPVEAEIAQYRQNLGDTFGDQEGNIDWDWLNLIATAKQRCKAFVLTMTGDES
jgi:hypothetical protein